MFFWQNKKHTQVIIFLDLVLVTLGFISAFWCKQILPSSFGGLSQAPHYYLVLFLLIIASYITFSVLHLNINSNNDNILKKIVTVWVAVGLSLIMLIIFLFVFHQEGISRLLFLLHFIFTAIFCSLRVYFFDKSFRVNDRMKDKQINILVIGSRHRAQTTIQTVLDSSGSFYNIIGCLDLEQDDVGKKVVADVRVIGTMLDFKHILLNNVVDEIIFALPLQNIADINDQITFAEKLGISIRIMPDWQLQKIMFRPETASISFDSFHGNPSLSLSSAPAKEISLLVKHFFDLSVATLGSIVISPLLLLIAASIKLTSKGPVLFSQERMGLNGRRFKVLKFRTMVEDAEKLKGQLADSNEMDGPVFKIKKDPRVTRIGRFLRKSSLDELPQLFNVVKGDMSLVGPRPPIPMEVDAYLPCYRRRLSMRPGITCIWQVTGRNNIDFEEWMKLDLQYIDEWSLWLDARLLFLTVRAVLSGSGS